MHVYFHLLYRKYSTSNGNERSPLSQPNPSSHHGGRLQGVDLGIWSIKGRGLSINNR